MKFVIRTVHFFFFFWLLSPFVALLFFLFMSYSPISPQSFPSFFLRFLLSPQFVLLKIFNVFFWNVTPCSLVDIYRCFSVTRCLRLQDGIWRKRRLLEASLSFYQCRRRHVVFIAVRMSDIAISVPPRVIRHTQFDRLIWPQHLITALLNFHPSTDDNTAGVHCMKTVREKCSFEEQTRHNA
jgi:hypothetical protein